ncbi:MAG: ATP-binding protein [Desulforhabdus sp.]|jgi:two-component system sensor histidine kinase HydH|nr:ATP-binding protein [Desulforhabdus sp.]
MSFEVVRTFQPWLKHKGRFSRNQPCPLGAQRADGRDLFIMVGLDPTPFEQARQQDLQQTLLLFGIIFLVGAAGIISLIWAQHYRLARSSLSDMRAFTSTLVGQMPVGLIVVDQDENIQTTNDAAKKILKTSRLSGKIATFPCFGAIAKQLKQEEAVLEQEVHCRTLQGEGIPLLLNASVIRDGEQRTTGYVFLFTDITEIKQLEEQLRRSERLAALGRLAAGVAHEIRNPLSSIKGFATILAGKFKGDDSGRKIAEVMGQEVERLNRVVTELLDFARPTELNKEVQSCKDLIRSTLRLVEKDALQQKVVIESRVDPPDLQVEVDPDRFAQVLLNIYLNALQAMEDGGKLTIEAFRQSDQVVFQAIDTGTGIADEHLPHIFDPYFTTKPHGVGLGLANVHKLVEGHGGDIEAVSSCGHGTTMIIRLPSPNAQGKTAEVSTRDEEIAQEGSVPRLMGYSD